jgi:hypothetical protein
MAVVRSMYEALTTSVHRVDFGFATARVEAQPNVFRDG